MFFILVNNFILMIKKIKTILKKLAIGINDVIVYSLIIFSILLPMFAVIGCILYFSWVIIGDNYYRWTWGYYIISLEIQPFIIIIEILIFCIGLGLFLTGFIIIVKKMKEEETLIQSGIYKYIRHPQNLGGILLFFPFALYIPGVEDIVIRISGIFSWGVSAFFLCLYSYYEEWCLMKNYNEEYIDYYKKTGFFIPKIWHRKKKTLTKIRFIRKILITFIVFSALFIMYYFIVLSFIDELIF